MTFRLLLQKLFSDFALQGFSEEKLNTRAYQAILNRIQMEEATASVTESSSSSGVRDDET